jgi:hypothetical protein
MIRRALAALSLVLALVLAPVEIVFEKADAGPGPSVLTAWIGFVITPDGEVHGAAYASREKCEEVRAQVEAQLLGSGQPVAIAEHCYKVTARIAKGDA